MDSIAHRAKHRKPAAAFHACMSIPFCWLRSAVIDSVPAQEQTMQVEQQVEQTLSEITDSQPAEGVDAPEMHTGMGCGTCL